MGHGKARIGWTGPWASAHEAEREPWVPGLTLLCYPGSAAAPLWVAFLLLTKRELQLVISEATKILKDTAAVV